VLNQTQLGKRNFTATTQLSEGEVLARLQQLVTQRAPGAIRGSVHGNTFVLLGPSPVGSYPRRFTGRVLRSDNATVIEGRFQLHPIAQLLLRILTAIALITGVVTSFQQQSLKPLIVAALIVIGGFFVLRRQVNRSALGEEAVVRTLVDIANSRRESA